MPALFSPPISLNTKGIWGGGAVIYYLNPAAVVAEFPPLLASYVVTMNSIREFVSIE